ncbi:MAG: peptidylprolyl isomerase [Chloroherpetonaceae bacterium]|nr:peptidylprolyl isomerase [Chloroherpetonaceae bacterium]
MRHCLWAVFLLCAAQSLGQPFWKNAEMRAAKEASDQRRVGLLLSHLDKSDALDAFVLYELASVQSDSAIDAILRKLSSPSARVREYAALALGQTLRLSPNASRFEDTVLALIAAEKNRAVRYELVIALGHFASCSAMEKLLDLNLKDRVLKDAIAEAIARAALRRVVSEKLTAAAALLYRETARSPMFNFALYALSRIGDSTLLAPHQHVLLAALRAQNADQRALAATACASLRTPESQAALLNAMHDTDWRVAVNALRALSRYPTPDAAALYEAALPLLRSPNYHLQKETLHLLLRYAPSDELHASASFSALLSAVELLCESSSLDIQTDALQTLAVLAPDRAASKIQQRISAPTQAMLTAMGTLAWREKQVRPEWLSVLQESALDTTSPLATAAIRSLGNALKIARHDSTISHSIVRTLEQAMVLHARSAASNTSAVQAAAEILSDSLAFSPQSASAFRQTLSILRSEHDAETVMMLLQALVRLQGSAALPVLEQYFLDRELSVRKTAAELYLRLTGQRPTVDLSIRPPAVDWAFFNRFSRNPLATIETTKGSITVELFIEEAPFTVRNFIKLAEAKFYDGLRFHRVVPNFVVQGGDPKGDGTGGPPYSIRTEFTRRRFERGILGLASAGKDTEGSQFFIMHSHHPHLDGRYTAFGLVKRGMNVVDRLEVGDRILSIRITGR